MEKSGFEQMGGTYRQEGNYLLPNLVVPENVPIGIWGQRRRRYLREYRKPFYTAMLLSGKLDNHLVEIRACLKNAKTPKRRIFLRHSALNFLAGR